MQTTKVSKSARGGGHNSDDQQRRPLLPLHCVHTPIYETTVNTHPIKFHHTSTARLQLIGKPWSKSLSCCCIQNCGRVSPDCLFLSCLFVVSKVTFTSCSFKMTQIGSQLGTIYRQAVRRTVKAWRLLLCYFVNAIWRPNHYVWNADSFCKSESVKWNSESRVPQYSSSFPS